MLKDKLTLVIHTCDKFSDLWDGHICLLRKNWKDCPIRILMVTDKSTEKSYDGVEIFAAGEGKQLSERLAAVLPEVTTEYLLQTLDDYYPIYRIDTEKINSLICAMDNESLDYIRLFKRPDSKDRIEGYDSLYRIHFDGKKDIHYQVNMYPGIWRKSFVEMTVNETKNAWEYELSLTRIARENDLYCAMSKGKEYELLDVVRKGKLLHRAKRYLDKHPGLYSGSREVVPYRTEFKIWFRTKIKDLTPQAFVDFLKSVTRRFGAEYYSDIETKKT